MDVVIVLAPLVYGENQSPTLVSPDQYPELIDQLKHTGVIEQLKKGLKLQQVVKTKNTKHNEKQNQCPQLTPRENEVLMLIAKGLTQKEVARVLELSPATVAGYKKEIYRKLDISSAAEATIEAIKYGLICIDEI